METVRLSFAFCILWFFANYTTNASLAYTSVGSSTILASMSGKTTTNKYANTSNSLLMMDDDCAIGLFTLGFGAMFKVEKITVVKLISVCTR